MIQTFSTEVERYIFRHTQIKYNCGDLSIERYLLYFYSSNPMHALFYKNIIYKCIEAEIFDILREIN